MGDLSCVMPAFHPCVGGATGTFHGSDFEIVDPIAACVASEKMQLAILLILLAADAQRAKRIIEEYKAPFASKKEFLSFLDSLYKFGDRIEYGKDEAVAHVNLQ